MSNFYSLVTDIISSHNLDEANNKLFGRNGIEFNSREYFENIVSSFIKKKEFIIRKENGQLLFDLTNYDDIWNILFLGEYIREKYVSDEEYNDLLKEIDEIKQKLQVIKDKHKKATTREEHAEINRAFQLLNVELIKKEKNLKIYKDVLDTFDQIDWVKLENSNDDIEKLDAVKKLKQALNVIHRLRNNIGHGNDFVGMNLEIEDNKFSVSIPIEYLDGFNKGRIIASEEDQVLVEKTNITASPLLEALNYDVKKVESFFYNVDPEWLSFLLEQVNYDYDELYQLNPDIFSFETAVRTFLKKGYSLNVLNSFRHELFLYWRNSLELLERNIDINKLPDEAFRHPKSVIKLKGAEIDIYQLPDEAFLNPESVIRLKGAGIDIYQLPDLAFKYSESVIRLKEVGFDIYQLPYAGFEYPSSVIKLYEAGIDINKLSCSGAAAFHYPSSVIKLYEAGIDIYKLSSNMAFRHPFLVIKLYEAGVDVCKLPYEAFINLESAIVLSKVGIDINKLPGEAFKYPKTVIRLKEAGINIYQLSGRIFINLKSTIAFSKAGIDIYQLPDVAFKNPESVIKLKGAGIDVCKLPYDAFKYLDSVIVLSKAGIDIYQLPYAAFKNPNLVVRLKEAGIDVCKLPCEAFHNFDYILDFYSKGIDIYRLPWNKIYRDVNVDNVKYLLNLVHGDYDKLETFPAEFFTCDISLIDEMYQTYNSNVARSIFGINNPKIIATLLYCNSVFRKYQKENNDSAIIDFAPISFMKLGAGDTFQFKNNITDVEMDSKTYLDQFVKDYDGHYRDSRSLKNNILDKLRNSTCHFRFKLVKNQNGKIMKDKIYLYDRFSDSSDTNFNMILDIHDLVKVARSIELGLEKKNTIVDREEHEENTIHRSK